jgi:SAM-dependent methyltransferase
MINPTSAFDRFLSRYQDGRVPWDDPTPPPEIEALAMTHPPGRVLDLGCGYGRAAIFLARHGWMADGVDFIPQAIGEAKRRAAAAGVGERARFYVASAAALGFLRPPYDLAIDVGCMHSFSDETLRAYHAELVRLLRPGGLYLLFANLREGEPDDADDGPRGIEESTILSLLAGDFVLERVERGMTQVEDRPPWKSGWFWFVRRH